VTILGGMLHIKPLIELVDGEVKPVAALRTTKKANEQMLSLLLQEGELERLAILHTGAEARAKEFLNMVMEKAIRSMPRDILMVNVTPTIGTHVGPNGLGFASVRK
jgi:fatty acid-binding protein DegV